MGAYLRPGSLDEALDSLRSGPLTLLAGGTDFYPARVGRVIDENILDLTRIDGLRGIDDRSDHRRIGALTTWSDLLAAPLPVWFDALKLAAREVGGMQIQNAGTIAGNLCNASPAADGVPPLLALDARIELSSADRKRELPLAQFIRGSRKTARAADEIVTAILIPNVDGEARSSFMKLGARKYLLISTVMAAAVVEVVEVDGKTTIRRARIAVGACSAVALRLDALEARLVGLSLAAAGSIDITDADLAALTPITDVRGTADYRRDAARTVVGRVLRECMSGMGARR